MQCGLRTRHGLVDSAPDLKTRAGWLGRSFGWLVGWLASYLTKPLVDSLVCCLAGLRKWCDLGFGGAVLVIRSSRLQIVLSDY